MSPRKAAVAPVPPSNALMEGLAAPAHADANSNAPPTTVVAVSPLPAAPPPPVISSPAPEKSPQAAQNPGKNETKYDMDLDLS